jgi:type II secretory pathway pseudopilin PulG
MNLKRNQKGIAMIESLISITIILTSIMAPMSVIISSSKFARAGIMRIQATYIANDGAEMILNYRKTLNTFCFKNPTYPHCDSGPGGDLSISSFNLFVEQMTDLYASGGTDCTKSVPCVFDETSFVATEAPAYVDFQSKRSTCGFLKKDPVSKTFGCGSGEETRFYRYMYSEKMDNNNFSNGSDAGPAGIMITTVVCFDRKIAECEDQQDMKNKVIIKNYVSK